MSATRCPGCNCWRGVGPCQGCAYWARRAREREIGRRCAQCYAMLPEEHGYSRCTSCQKVRHREDFVYRWQRAKKRFPRRIRGKLVARLAAGERLTAVCADLGITSQLVHGYKAYDEAWADDLDAALMAGRDPELRHGTPMGYSRQGCRCPECREAKAAPPLWWRKRSA